MSVNFMTKDAVDGISNLSPYTQITLGAGTGLVTGYVLLKISKTVAILAGASILIAQLAIQAGLIRTNPLETIVLQGHQGSRHPDHGRVMPTEVNPQSREAVRERLIKAYDVVAGSSRLCVAMFGGFLLGFGLA